MTRRLFLLQGAAAAAALTTTRSSPAYISMNCQDWVVTSDGKAKEAPLGKGVVDWKKVFTAAKKARIETTLSNWSKILH